MQYDEYAGLAGRMAKMQLDRPVNSTYWARIPDAAKGHHRTRLQGVARSGVASRAGVQGCPPRRYSVPTRPRAGQDNQSDPVTGGIREPLARTLTPNPSVP